MRVVFAPPSEVEFKTLFLSEPLRKGGGLEDISVFYPSHRRGGGVFSAIAGIARRVLPFLLNVAKPSVKEFGRSVLSDVVNDQLPLRESLKRHGVTALKSTGRRILNGSGRVARKKVGGGVRRTLASSAARRGNKKNKKKKKRMTNRRVKSRSKYNKDVYDLL